MPSTHRLSSRRRNLAAEYAAPRGICFVGRRAADRGVERGARRSGFIAGLAVQAHHRGMEEVCSPRGRGCGLQTRYLRAVAGGLAPRCVAALRAVSGCAARRLSRSAAPRPLHDDERRALEPYIPWIDLEAARIHEGTVPWYLPACMAGITRGHHIYLRPGAYRRGARAGIALLAHELCHVGQYRQGMRWYSYLWSVRRGYCRHSRFEAPAYELEARVLFDLARPAGTGPCPARV